MEKSFQINTSLILITVKRGLLRVGIVDFTDRTRLLVGDGVAFSWLASQIYSRRKVRLAETHGASRQTRVDLRIIPRANSSRLTRSGDIFELYISDADALRFTQQLIELAMATTPAHIYLDSKINATNIQFIASKGEYNIQSIFVDQLQS